MRGLCNGRACRTTGIHAEQTKGWLRGVEREEEEEEDNAGTWDVCRTFVRLVKVIWETGCVPQQMLWTIIILLPKGGGDERGIGLRDPVWKVIDIVLDNYLKGPRSSCLSTWFPGRPRYGDSCNRGETSATTSIH